MGRRGASRLTTNHTLESVRSSVAGQSARPSGESTRRCTGSPARAHSRRQFPHQDIATDVRGSPLRDATATNGPMTKGAATVGSGGQGKRSGCSPRNLRQRQLILTPMDYRQCLGRHLVKDYCCGEIAGSRTRWSHAYALRNRYLLPADTLQPALKATAKHDGMINDQASRR